LKINKETTTTNTTITDQIIKLVKNIFDFELVTKKLGIIRIKTAIRKIAGIISFNPIN